MSWNDVLTQKRAAEHGGSENGVAVPLLHLWCQLEGRPLVSFFLGVPVPFHVRYARYISVAYARTPSRGVRLHKTHLSAAVYRGR